MDSPGIPSSQSDLAAFLFGDVAATFAKKPIRKPQLVATHKRGRVKRGSVVPDSAFIRPSRTADSVDTSDVDVHRLMDDISKTLPSELLLKHDMHEAVKLRACSALVNSVERVRLRHVVRAKLSTLRRWHATAHDITYASAVTITRFIRQRLEQLKAKQHFDLLVQQMLAARRRQLETEANELRCALMLQRWIRRRTARTVLAKVIHRYNVLLRARKVFSVIKIGQLLRKYVHRLRIRKAHRGEMASIMQAAGRGFIARRNVLRLIAQKKHAHLPMYERDNQTQSLYFTRNGAALVIQKGYKQYVRHCGRVRVKAWERAKIDEAGRILRMALLDRLIVAAQCAVRMFISRRRLFHLRYAFRGKFIVRIQRAWKRSIARSRLHSLLHKKLLLTRMRRSAHRVMTAWLQSTVESRKRSRDYKAALHRREIEAAGRLQFTLSNHFAWASQLWNTARLLRDTSDLHKFFASVSLGGMLDMSKAQRIMRACEGLLDKRINPKLIDLMYTKVRARTEKKIDYPRFLDLLFTISAAKTLQVDVSNKTDEEALSTTKSSDYYNETLFLKLSDKDMHKIRSFTMCRLRGKAALIVHFVYVYLSTNPEYSRIVQSLGVRSSSVVAAKFINTAGARIYDVVRFQIKYRKWHTIKKRREEVALEQLRMKCATCIQSFVRGNVGRKLSTARAQQVYFKYMDLSLSLPYWYNARSGVSFWTKPNLLRNDDCGFPVSLPEEDLLFIVYCSICETKTLQCVCDECDDVMCDPCFHKTHKSGARRLHERIAVPSCVRCEFQIGSKLCLLCKDAYCDTCYEVEHRRGKFRNHMFKWLTDSCVMCVQRSAQWSVCNEATEYMELWLCSLCCKNNYGDPNTTIGVTKRKFVGFLVSERRQAKNDAKDRADRSAAYLASRLIDREAARFRCAVTIQRVFRGFISRKHAAPFIEERKHFLALCEEAKKEKSRLKYLLDDFFGFARHMKTDTIRERVLKLFPLPDRRVVEECIDREWDDAFAFVLEREAHETTVNRINLAKSLWFKFLTKLYARLLKRTEQRLTDRSSALDKLRLLMRAANAREEKQALKRQAERAADSIEKLMHKISALSEQVKDFESKSLKHSGPRRLFDLVSHRRRHGIPLALRLEMKSGHSTARAVRAPVIDDVSGKPAKGVTLRSGDEVNLNGHIFVVLSCGLESHGSVEVVFNRSWNGPDCEYDAKKRVDRVFYLRPFYLGSRIVFLSWPGQYVVNLSARALNGTSSLLSYCSVQFEEDSFLFNRFKMRSKEALAARDFTCMYSVKPVDMDPPYSLGNMTKQAIVKAAAAKAFVTKLVRLFVKASKPVPPYQMWKNRIDQLDIKCVLSTPGSIDVLLGEFRMHLDAPCDICRQYVQRNFRVTLNRSIGNAFLFVYNDASGQLTTLSRDNEPKTYSKKVIPFVIHPTTLMGVYTLTITADLFAAPEHIAEFAEEEEKLEDALLGELDNSVVARGDIDNSVVDDLDSERPKNVDYRRML